MSSCSLSSGFSNDGCGSTGVQDKVCLVGSRIITTVGAAGAEQIYFANLAVSSTGYIKILSTPAAAVITLSFLLNNTALSIPAGIETLTAGEAVAFTVVGFDEITIASTVTGTVSFEYSLTPRYRTI
ncbi:hypothetical protein SAMN05444487_11331 [Marininema mesophilum]|uniref:Endospore appendages core domain-containing protein n=1 Tax=Marininema mesophilum TaxID=1048340 RepID=A0A1H3AD99_9BACL|nr:S-Ena type endospore appendage [Marininema mesophilum]SDX27144.1 hypothetical protein SAMN05444487_11331 [Marininema mesophilum]